jgi:Tol biopolymer transport system component
MDPQAEPQTLTAGRDPVVTPDGGSVVYSAPTRDGWKLWRMNPDGSGKRRFGKGPYEETDPAVSPDGRFVAYVGFLRKRHHEPLLLIRPMDGSTDRLIKLDGNTFHPAW